MRDIIYCIHCGEIDKLENGICTNCGCLQIKKQTLPDEQPENNIMAQQETIFAQGIRLFDKHPNQPDFVLASQVISLEEFFNFCTANPQFLADYQGKKQLKMQILRSKDGKIYMGVDTYGTPAAATAPAPAQQQQQGGWAPQQQPAQQRPAAPAQPGWGAPAQQQPAQQRPAAPAQSGWGAPAPATTQQQGPAGFDYGSLPF